MGLPTLAFILLHCVFGVLAQIQIDDAYAYSNQSLDGVQYSWKEWNDNNQGFAANRFRKTYHNAELPGAHFTYFFQGSEIKYYGDRDPKGGPINITLDGALVANILGNATEFQFQQLLWSTSGLDSSDHQLVVTGVSGTFGLDWLEITPLDGRTDARTAQLGPGASGVPAGAWIVDDTDGGVTYSGLGWQQGNDGPGSAAYLKSTVHRTATPGDSVTFNFTGTAVWFFTDSTNGNAPVSISVDGGTAETIQTVPSSGSGARSQKLTWSKTGLSDSRHLVVIKHVGNAGSLASVDFFMYMPSANLDPSTGKPKNEPPDTNRKPTPVGAIVGAVVGAVIASLSALCLFFFKRSRRQKREQEQRRMEQTRRGTSYHDPESFVKEVWNPAPGAGSGHVSLSRGAQGYRSSDELLVEQRLNMAPTLVGVGPSRARDLDEGRV
ncbi:hypothetical protein RhiJN_09784 [Ceratobasidium sp. AG-Ba]|nr:hypothetical protein RhiJN_09784 [Ceratobasidium sp. AG-Ba]